MPLSKKNTEKRRVFYSFLKKDKNNMNIPYTNEDLGTELVRFYPPWCANLNTTAQSTQKWQLKFFREIEL